MTEESRPSQAQRDFAEALLRDHGTRLRRIARRHSINADDAEEALQRMLMIAMRADPEMPGHPLAWATTVLKREAWAIHRQRANRVQGPVVSQGKELDPLASVEAPQARPDELAERAEHVRAFRKAFDSLKPQEREVLLLLGSGFTYQQIEEEMGYTFTKINRCVAEGRAALRERMSAWEREGSVALEDIHNLRAIPREPTQTLLRRRERLLASRRAESRRTADVERGDQWHQRLLARLANAKAHRLALEAGRETSGSQLLDAKARERDALNALRRFGGDRGGRTYSKKHGVRREETLVAIDAELAKRRETIVLNAVRNQPAYVLEAFGPRPPRGAALTTWCKAVDRLVALRQLHGITNSERALGDSSDSAAKSVLEKLRRAVARDAPSLDVGQKQAGPEVTL